METEKKRKQAIYKKLNSNFSESSNKVFKCDEHMLKDCTNMFDHIEGKALKIKVDITENFCDILGWKKKDYEDDKDVPDYLQNLCLDDFSTGEIMAYSYDENPQLDEIVSAFLKKLKFVVMSNYELSSCEKDGGHIDDMAKRLMEMAKYDDGKRLVIVPCHFKLMVGDRTFSSKADRAGIKDIDKNNIRKSATVWVMETSKPAYSMMYGKGDVQLASCMIAAYQDNYRKFKNPFPERMIGIRVMGDELHFYSISMNKLYLQDLERGFPKRELTVMKYPSKKGLKISNVNQRRHLLHCLWKLREYLLMI